MSACSLDHLKRNASAQPGDALVLGKPLGIVLATFLVVRLGLGELPVNTGHGHILGIGLVAGIGFTVSLFIADLAFSSAQLTAEAKVGILAASLISGIAGALVLAGGGRDTGATATTEAAL